MFHPSKYRDNKIFELSNSFQICVLSYLETLDDRIEKAKEDNKPFFVDAFSKMRREFIKDLDKVGIKVAYGWPGHRYQWFFPTEYDAYMYEDWMVQCSD